MKNSLTLLFTLIALSSFSQNKVSFNGSNFGDCEVIDASISDEYLSIEVFEVDLENYDSDRYKDALPASYGIAIEVTDPKGIAFPLEPNQQLTYTLTELQYNLTAAAFNQEQLNKIDQDKIAKEKAELERDQPSIDAKAQEISKMLMEGKISPEEAARRIEALTTTSMSKMQYTTESINNIQSLEEEAQFSIHFYDTRNKVEVRMFSGKLIIKQFSESMAEVFFSGTGITECMESRAASSAEEKAKCISTASTLLPETMVLKEGPIEGYLVVYIKDFQNNR